MLGGVLQFTDAAGRLVAELGSEQGLLGKSKALLLSPLGQLGQLGQIGQLAQLGQDPASASRAANMQLRGALERFITDRYLPDIYVNFRLVRGEVCASPFFTPCHAAKGS